MATVDTPSPGLFAAVLHTLRSADPYETTTCQAVGPLAAEFTSEEAAAFPAALAGVLPLVRKDPPRTRFAAEIATTFDLWEVASDLARFAIEDGDPELVLAAAALCGTAGVNGSVADRLVRALPGELARAAEIRLRPDAVPLSSAERSLHLQRWPGARQRGDSSPAAPVVVLDSELEPSVSLRLSVELLRAGAVIRRLPPAATPFWFGPETIVVCNALTRTRILSSAPSLPEANVLVSPALDDEQDVASVLRRINSLLPPERRLRLTMLRTELATSIWDPEVYRLGVYQTREASFLTSAPTAAMYRLAKQGLLTPRRYGVYIWAFRDLVAVRTWQYLRSQSRKPISPQVVPRLATFSGDAQVVRVGATSGGRVLADRGSGWEDIVSGALVMDLPVEDVDDAFRPFSVGGRRAPDLLKASENTRLHPAVLHGAPYRRGHRITAVALATLENRNGFAAITAAYPELEGLNVTDTLEVGRQLLAAG